MSKIEELIPDEGIRWLIFSKEDWTEPVFLNSRWEMLKYYNAITVVAFAYLYGRYRKWKDTNPSVEEGSNSHRVINTFRRLYNNYDMTFDLMESMMVDVFIDQSEGGLNLLRDLKIQGMVPNNRRNDLSKYYYHARKFRRGPREYKKEEMPNTDKYDDLLDYIKLFPFLRWLRIREEQIPNVFNGKDENGPIEYKKAYEVSFIYDDPYISEEEIPLYSMIVKIHKEYYYLETVETKQDGAKNNLHLGYSVVRDSCSTRAMIVENEDNDQDAKAMVIRGKTAVEEYSSKVMPEGHAEMMHDPKTINDIYAVNYKYVKNLSLSISDVLNETFKKALIQQYSKTCASIFEDGDLNDIDSYDWDNIVGLLILEKSASNVLKTIFSKDGSKYESCLRILENLQIRFGSHRIDAVGLYGSIMNKLKSIPKWENEFIKDDRIHITATQAIQNNRKQNESEMVALAVVDALSMVSSKNRTISDNISFPIRMDGRINFLEDLILSSAHPDVKRDSLRRITKQTFRALICFYTGFFKYAEAKMMFEYESHYKCLSEKKILEHQRNAERAFNIAVNETVTVLALPENDNIQSLLNMINGLCLRCRKASGEQEIEGKLLKEALGRSTLLDFRVIAHISEIIERANDPDEVNSAISAVIEVFRYLMTGHRGKSNIKNRAIYPYVLTYEYSGKNRDGYNIGHYSMLMDKREMDIRILSEFTYTVNEKYFCLPNVLRANDSFWIEPITIGFVNFDKLMLLERSNDDRD